MSKIGVYIGGQPSSFASRLARRLRDEPEVEIVGGGDDGPRVIEEVTRLRPEVVLLETDLADGPVVDAVKSLKGACPDVSVIVVSADAGADSDADTLGEPVTGDDPRPRSDAKGDNVVSVILQVFSGRSVDYRDSLVGPSQDSITQRIVHWDDSNHLKLGAPGVTRLKKYHVLISNRRACPGCYERRVVRQGRGQPSL